jgi:hypothetical protein
MTPRPVLLVAALALAAAGCATGGDSPDIDDPTSSVGGPSIVVSTPTAVCSKPVGSPGPFDCIPASTAPASTAPVPAAAPTATAPLPPHDEATPCPQDPDEIAAGEAPHAPPCD